VFASHRDGVDEQRGAQPRVRIAPARAAQRSRSISAVGDGRPADRGRRTMGRSHATAGRSRFRARRRHRSTRARRSRRSIADRSRSTSFGPRTST
jgi:hypothetical protein